MNGIVYLNISGLFYIILIMLTFFLKSKTNNLEQKIYGILIIDSFFELFVGLITTLFMYYSNDFSLMIILSKIYFVTILLWIAIFSQYIFSLVKNNLSKLLLYITILFCLLILSLPLAPVITNSGVSADGIALYLLYIGTFFFDFICICYGLKSLKVSSEANKKLIPLWIFLVVGSIVSVIQVLNPEMFLLVPLEVFVSSVMYHTIENPDVQMLNEFHKVREKEEKSNDAKNEFLVNISNDIKTPIANIKSITSEALNSNDPEVLKNEIRRIQSSTGELSQLVSNILDITDMEKQKLGIKMNKYQVYNLFNVINKTFEKTIDNNIEYRFNYDNSIPEYLYGDSIRLKQIMNILLDNARDYTKKGFIEVNVNSIIKNDICRLIITVEDSGSGITSEELEHLFDKEKIYSDETLKLIDDTKNNLGIAKSLIDLMNGSITVKSELGIGSKFTIAVDQIIKEEEKTKIEETVDQYEKMLEKKKKILLVISSSDLSKKINLYLKKQPYDIVEVIGGQPCLERLRNKEKYNIILMEEKLEKLSSEDTLIKIKDTPGYKIPVVLITDNKGFGVKEMYQEKGYKDVIFMPIKKNDLLETIKNNLD